MVFVLSRGGATLSSGVLASKLPLIYATNLNMPSRKTETSLKATSREHSNEVPGSPHQKSTDILHAIPIATN